MPRRSELPEGVRRLPSGRFQGRWPRHIDVEQRSIGGSYETALQAAAARERAIRDFRAGRIVFAPQEARERHVEAPRTVADAVNALIREHRDLATSTIDGYRSARNAVICHPTKGIGTTPLADLTTPKLRAWKLGLRNKGVSKSMEKLAWKTLSSALSWEVEQGRLDRSPAILPVSRRTKSRVAEESTTDLKLPTWEEVWKIAVEIPRVSDRLMMLLMAWSGPRLSEAAAITPAQVSAANGTVLLKEVWAKPVGEDWKTEPLKAGQRRTVPVPAGLMKHLTSYLSNMPAPAQGRERVAFFPAVSQNRGGIGVYTRNNWRDNVWQPAVSSAGVGTYRTKDLRAYAASALLDAGATIIEARDLLGHARSETTERFYVTARELREHDPARMAIRNSRLDWKKRLDALYKAWVKEFGDPLS